MTRKYIVEIEIPSEVEASADGNSLVVKGQKGTIKRKILNPRLNLKIENKKITIHIKEELKETMNDKRNIYTYNSHIKNMIKGVMNGFTSKLKICSGHFPITVTADGNKLLVKNFLGEKVPRIVTLKQGAKVNVQGDIIEVSGIDKETVGQVAADIEQITRITKRDRRIFQDGCYIIEKPGDA